MVTVQSTVQWLESSLQSPPGFRIPFESSQSKISMPSSSHSAPPWPWTSCWPPCWPPYWGRPWPGRGPHIYFIVWTFQLLTQKKWKFVCLLNSIVCWAEQDVKALWFFFSFVTFLVFEFFHNLSFWVFEFCHSLSFVTFWVLSQFEFLSNFTITIRVVSHFEFLLFVTTWVFEYCHNLSCWL